MQQYKILSYKRNIMEEKERPQMIMLLDAWIYEDKSYVIYYMIDIKSKHIEMVLSEKEIKDAN